MSLDPGLDPLTASLLIGFVFGLPALLIAIVSVATARFGLTVRVRCIGGSSPKV